MINIFRFFVIPDIYTVIKLTLIIRLVLYAYQSI